MLSLPSTVSIRSTSSSPSISLHIFRRSPRCLVPRRFAFSTTCTAEATPDQSHEQQRLRDGSRSNLSGFRLEEAVEKASERSRLDSWISSRIPGVSRARIQSSIRSGLVCVNGRTVDKVSHVIKAGDKVDCTVSELQPLSAEPEDIPVDIVYEDDNVLVVNKPAHMVVHPAPGNANGTLVNAILHHCRLPGTACTNDNIFSEAEDVSESSDDEFEDSFDCRSFSLETSIRPGIVHRLDKGTSGLLVVAKDEHSHSHLAEQFKQHTIHRVYISLTSGVPSPASARVETSIARDPSNRLRMAAVSGSGKIGHARHAASRYRVLEVLAGGGSSLVEWRLETGRTHQIRVHAKYLGVPLLGDEVYGGTKSFALSLLRPKIPPSYHSHLSHMLSELQRPCLHALSLGFKHPHTGEDIKFSCPPPSDFMKVLTQLRSINSQKISIHKLKNLNHTK